MRGACLSEWKSLVQCPGTPGSPVRVEAATHHSADAVQRQPWLFMGAVSGRPEDPRRKATRGTATNQTACDSRMACRRCAQKLKLKTAVCSETLRPERAAVLQRRRPPADRPPEWCLGRITTKGQPRSNHETALMFPIVRPRGRLLASIARTHGYNRRSNC